MRLSAWAKKQSITYMSAWRMFKNGLLAGAYQLPTGTIIVPEVQILAMMPDHTVVYARVSSSENRTNLKAQAERVASFCAARGWIVHEIVTECASGLNDKRPKLVKILGDPSVTRIVVEHKDRLTRFGFAYIQLLSKAEIVVINEVLGDEPDLMQDFVSLVTCFSARLYGRRRSRRKTEEIIKGLQGDSP